jgi:hypothetical protein
MAVTGVKSDKSKSELIEEIAKLKKELKERNDEIALLKKKLALYKDLK